MIVAVPALTFDITDRATDCNARCGVVHTPNGSFATPVFMPVGTRGSVKGLLPRDVEAVGSEIILGNTYHLMLRPGSELVAEMGGLHRWTNWPRPILTDSGGFQVFSLADLAKIDDNGVTFRSPYDGAAVELTPERSMQVQNELGADIIMAFDDCPPAQAGAQGGSPAPADASFELESNADRVAGGGHRDARAGGGLPPDAPRHAVAPADYAQRVQVACDRSLRWLDRCVKAHARLNDQALFGIVQGGTDLDQRTWCVDRVTQHDLPGFAIGGVAVGEGYEGLKTVVEHTAPLLPDAKPRYLMGVGYERDILAAVRAGVDMFDCVLPTRNGRSANAFTSTGQIRLKNARFARDDGPIEEGCDCPACGGWTGDRGQETRDRGLGKQDDRSRDLSPDSCLPSPAAGYFSRSYLRHLFLAGEMLGPILVSLHNIRHFHRFLLDIRLAIRDNDWSLVRRRWPVAFI